jgi:hypothetical protein
MKHLLALALLFSVTAMAAPGKAPTGDLSRGEKALAKIEEMLEGFEMNGEGCSVAIQKSRGEVTITVKRGEISLSVFPVSRQLSSPGIMIKPNEVLVSLPLGIDPETSVTFTADQNENTVQVKAEEDSRGKKTVLPCVLSK